MKGSGKSPASPNLPQIEEGSDTEIDSTTPMAVDRTTPMTVVPSGLLQAAMDKTGGGSRGGGDVVE